MESSSGDMVSILEVLMPRLVADPRRNVVIESEGTHGQVHPLGPAPPFLPLDVDRYDGLAVVVGYGQNHYGRGVLGPDEVASAGTIYSPRSTTPGAIRAAIRPGRRRDDVGQNQRGKYHEADGQRRHHRG